MSDPRITDEAVEAACRGSWNHRHSADLGLTWDEAVQRESKTFDERKILLQPYRVSMRAALEAALPLLAAQPVAELEITEDEAAGYREQHADWDQAVYEADVAKGMPRLPGMAAFAPQPVVDREALIDVVRGFANDPDDPDVDGWVFFADEPGDIADAVLALLNGGAS